MLVQPDGKVLVAASDSGPVVARFDSDGTLDPTFGAGNGIASFASVSASPGGSLQAGNLTLTASGKILLTLNDTGLDGTVYIEQLLADGTPDKTFGTGGSVDTQLQSGTGPSLADGPDGRIVLAPEQGWGSPLREG